MKKRPQKHYQSGMVPADLTPVVTPELRRKLFRREQEVHEVIPPHKGHKPGGKKINRNPYNTNAYVSLNPRTFMMIEVLRSEWGCSKSRAVRRLLSYFVVPVMECMKAKEEEKTFTVTLSMKPEYYDNFIE